MRITSFKIDFLTYQSEEGRGPIGLAALLKIRLLDTAKSGGLFSVKDIVVYIYSLSKSKFLWKCVANL